MKAITVSALISMSLFAAQAYAGASNTVLSCKSADGKVTLQGHVPGDIAEFELKANMNTRAQFAGVSLSETVNQKTGQLESHGQIVVIEDLAQGVYTLEANDMNAEKNGEMIRLYAIPSTVKYKKGSNSSKASFSAKLTASGENGSIDRVLVKCSTDYSI